MEFNITDLLDDVQDIPLDVAMQTAVCNDRIRELTMKKIRTQANAPTGRPGRFLAKAALLAAVLVCLSVTVLAAVGDYIPQWLSQDPEETIGYDNDLYIGSSSKNWDLEGWIMELKAEAVSPTGLTVVCKEWGGQGQMGTLTAEDTYWLEKWNGSGYDMYLPEKSPAVYGGTATIQANTTQSWQISWEDSYGTLNPGSYRLGKNFCHTSNSGETQNMTGYVKFRVLETEMAAYYTQFETALKTLCERQNWNLTWQVFPEDPVGYTSYIMDIWKDGNNYLENLRYLDENGVLIRQSSISLWDGVGYRLSLDDGNAYGGIIPYKRDDTVQSSRFYMWHTFSELSDARICEIRRQGNVIVYQESIGIDTEDNWEITVILNEVGQIKSIQRYRVTGAEKTLYSVLTVHETEAAEIARMITDQKPDNGSAQE